MVPIVSLAYFQRIGPESPYLRSPRHLQEPVIFAELLAVLDREGGSACVKGRLRKAVSCTTLQRQRLPWLLLLREVKLRHLSREQRSQRILQVISVLTRSYPFLVAKDTSGKVVGFWKSALSQPFANLFQCEAAEITNFQLSRAHLNRNLRADS